MNSRDKNSKLISSSVTSEAASWVAQLDGDTMNNADRLALKEWAARSPGHLSELRRLGDLWVDVDAILQAEIEAERVIPSMGRLILSSFKVRPGLAYGVTAVAATFLMAVGVMLTPLSYPPEPLLAPVQIAYAVPAGENKIFSLEDGTLVHANTDSLFEVEYSPERRVIRLTKGEAHFDVMHDAKRPFVVYADGHIVKAVGTAFVVKIGIDKTSVIVTEGKVELNSLNRRGPDGDQTDKFYETDVKPAYLSAGESAVIEPTDVDLVAEIRPLTPEIIDKKLAWREGLVIFEGEALTEVIDEISRYTDLQIVISDPEIRNVPIGGAFPAGEVQALLGALQTSFGVSVVEVGDDVIYLKKSITE